MFLIVNVDWNILSESSDLSEKLDETWQFKLYKQPQVTNFTDIWGGGVGDKSAILIKNGLLQNQGVVIV